MPASFRFDLVLHPVGAPGSPDTEIRGAYRDGAWEQSAQTRGLAGGANTPGQEFISIGGATYTRPTGAPKWTRWPGTSFDAAYGLTSPFTALRLFAVADRKASGEQASLEGMPEPLSRIQTAVSASTVRNLMQAGAAVLTPDAEKQATLLQQVAVLVAPQTITYWIDSSGRVRQAASTLVALDENGQPAPWMQTTWRFWGYDDPAINVTGPADFEKAPGPQATAQPPSATSRPPGLTSEGTLVVRVFASPGVPAENLEVSVYPAGDSRQPVDWRTQAQARFNLPPGRYDALVQTDYAQEWLRGLDVKLGTELTRDVTFDFGTLRLIVLRDGKPVPADIVTYPAGNRQNWVDWRSDNPATVRLRAGVYDVEISYDDYRGHQTVTGLEINSGETTERTVTLSQ